MRLAKKVPLQRVRQWLDDRILDRDRTDRARRVVVRMTREAEEEVNRAYNEGKRGNDLEYARYAAYFDVGLAEDDLRRLITRRLVQEAYRRYLEVPPRSEESEL